VPTETIPELQGEVRHLRPEALGSRRAADHQRVIATSWGRRDALTRRLLAVADAAGLAGALIVTQILLSERIGSLAFVALGLGSLPIWIVLFKLYGLYDRDIKRISHATLDDVPWLFHAFVIGTLIFAAYFALLPAETWTLPGHLTLSEGLILALSGVVLIGLLRTLVRRAFVGVLGPERVLLAGTGERTQTLVRKIAQHPEYGLSSIGLITPDAHGRVSILGQPVLGGVAEFERIARERAVERVVICRQDFSEEQVLGLIQTCRMLSIKVSLLPAVVDALGPSVEIDEVEGVTVLGVNPPVLSRTSRGIKRCFDLIVASLLMIVSLVPLAVIAVAIRLDSSGPILFRQERIGKSGRHFRLLKFRTMVADAEERREELFSRSLDPNWLHLDHDPRVTRVGRFLRLSSLDELPQLWNVLRGEMSLVGPRPLVEEEDRLVDGWMRGRLDLMPGITGLWQVLGRTSIPFDEMVKIDYLYVANWSLWFDVRILIRTLPIVLSRRGAN
jgi:exopolysaccharide biosynthesis polyprenyl glycosylphosphotransferase